MQKKGRKGKGAKQNQQSRGGGEDLPFDISQLAGLSQEDLFRYIREATAGLGTWISYNSDSMQ